MQIRKTRFVAGTQQLLVIGAVFAALIPAASVVSLDVVREQPDSQSHSPVTTALAAYSDVADAPSAVDGSVAEPVVHDVRLTASAAVTKRSGKPGLVLRAGEAIEASAEADDSTGITTILSEPQEVTGFGTVGVTWDGRDNVNTDEVSVQIRTKTDGAWGEWQDVHYHDDHAADPGTAEALSTRPGTDEALVGHVDQVQVKAEFVSEKVPADLTMTVINPGEPAKAVTETPAISTSEIDTETAPAAPVESAPVVEAPAEQIPVDEAPAAETPAPEAPATETPAARDEKPALALSSSSIPIVEDTSDDELHLDGDGHEGHDHGVDDGAISPVEDGLELVASGAAKPNIYSRAQWRANEKIRDQDKPSYGRIQGGFVHHTVNTNNYTAAEVPGIIRSIYSYHVKSRGWRDIGYNFFVDKYGRIWEGRWGGVDKAVVGAHTEGYNSNSFAMSAIGNYETSKPSEAFIGAYAALFAWKFSIHGVSATATSVKIGSKTFPSAIMGHRDTKATACPGKYLYARLPDIRRATAALQKTWSFTARTTNLVGSWHPDLITRRASDKKAVIIPTTGPSGFSGKKVSTGSSTNNFRLSPDLTGDGVADLIVWSKSGLFGVRPGTKSGSFNSVVAQSRIAKGMNMMIPVGDINGNKKNDLIGRRASDGALIAFLGQANGTFKSRTLAVGSFKAYNWISAADIDGDGRSDLVARDTKGKLWWHPRPKRLTFGARESLGTGYSGASSMAVADFNLDGRADIAYIYAKNKKGYIRLGNGGSGFGGNFGPYASLGNIGVLSGATQMLAGKTPEIFGVRGTELNLLKKKDGTDVGTPIVTNLSLANANLVMNAGDWNRDGKGDVIYRHNSGTLYLTLGNGAGRFTGAYSLGNFKSFSLIMAVGDINGDGSPDLLAQDRSGMKVFPGTGKTGVKAGFVWNPKISGSANIYAGTWDADKAADVVVRNGDKLMLYRGNGAAGLLAPKQITTGVSGYNWMIGVGKLSSSGDSDILARDKSGRLWALRSNAHGEIKSRWLLGYGFNGYDLAG